MSRWTLRLRGGAVVSLLIAAGALVVPVATSFTAVSASAEHRVEEWCDVGYKDESVSTPFVVPAPPENWTWTLLVIKAGSVDTGHGPGIDTPIVNPTVGGAYTHSSGKEISYIILCREPDEPETTAPVDSTEPPLTTEPETTEPETTEPETTEPETTEPETTEPETTRPVVSTQPTTTEPPVTTEPETTGPVATTQAPTTTTGIGPGGGTRPPAPGPTLAPPLGQMPSTGTATSPVAAVAGSLLLLGGAALLVGRRVTTRR